MAYFLDPLRMVNPAYLNRFLSILASKLGRPLLDQLSEHSVVSGWVWWVAGYP